MIRHLFILGFLLIFVSCNQEKEKHFTIHKVKDKGVFGFKNDKENTLVYSGFVVEIKNMTDNDITEASGYVIELDQYPQFGSFLQIELAKKIEIVEYNCVFREDISFENPWKSGEIRTLSYDLTELGDSFSYNYPMLKGYDLKSAELYLAIECKNELLNYNFAEVIGKVNLKEDLNTFILDQSEN
ncbi:hypothetical protein [Psychroserpens sp.]|uniref:hypothetical protein n=1 Tax=Psychroserpens sp. TaxID=2020870 RepID=UPI00385ACD8D